MAEPHHWQAICAVVEQLPHGRVATYGQVARLAGLPGRARLVGKVLGHLPPGVEVPWHRVINASGKISLPDRAGLEQRARLEAEGVEFRASGRIDLRRFGLGAD